MTTRIVLTPDQTRELELVLGGWSGHSFGAPGDSSKPARLPAPELPDGATLVTLVDPETTAIGEIDAVVDGGWVTGSVRALRALGHRDHRDRRVTQVDRRGARAVIITGDVPDAADERWRGLDDKTTILLLDQGNTRQLGRDIAAVTALGRDPLVLPCPDQAARSAEEWREAVLSAARWFVADDAALWQTDRSKGDGMVILLTGLSGSGKSTVAKLLSERLAELDDRVVSLLDGDEVRQMLSAGLGFSRGDRERNVRRIGWVAALVAKHGGIAICAPIAPYASMRAEMRAFAEKEGRFVLVHVSTPLEVCEARDRKGLYAKARRGEIEQFTGISDPYEAPHDAHVVIDTSELEPDAAVERILMYIDDMRRPRI